MLYHTQNPHGGDLYSAPVRLDYSANINPYGTPEAVKLAVQDSLQELLNYPDPECRELVEAISDFEQVPKHRILCGSGAAELIYSYCNALKPKKGLVLAPSFCEYETAMETAGCRVAHYYLQQENDFAVDGRFPAFLREWQGDVLFLCNPNNPTGQVMEAALLEEILQIVHEKGIRLFLDECFLDLTEGGESCSQKRQLSRYPELLILKAFTKGYGMAGLRLGYCVTSDEQLLEAMSKQVQLWNVSIPAQKAGVAALTQWDFLEKANRCIRQERQVLTGGLKQLGFRVIPTKTNFILFYTELPMKTRLMDRGILIRSCDNYPGLCRGWYRIAVKLPEENAELLAAMEEIVHG